MPTIHDFGAFKIFIFFGDHNPPHFHVLGPGFGAKIRIADLEVTAGAMPPSIRRRALRWAAANRAILQTTWDSHAGE